MSSHRSSYRRDPFPWYVFIFAVHPVLALFAHNVAETDTASVIRPLILSWAATVALFLVCRRMYADSDRAAFALTGLGFLFFTYGYAVTHGTQRATARSFLVLTNSDVSAWLCLALWLLAIGGIFVLTGRTHRNLHKLSAPLKVAALVLIAAPSFQLARHVYLQAEPLQLSRDTARRLSPAVENPPDIYYIVLDSYGRSDLLREQLGYDNSAFLDQLRSLGFVVSNCSQSNYPRTALSLASSLNMDYLADLSAQFAPGSSNLVPLQEALLHGAVRRSLATAGYRTVAFATGVPWSEWRDADEFIRPRSRDVLNEFEIVLTETTALKILDDLDVVNIPAWLGHYYRQRTQLALESLETISRSPAPKFVFMHVMAPHQPFVLDVAGHPVNPRAFLVGDGYTRSSYRRGYVLYVEYVNAAVLRGVRALIKQSSRPPVIVIQGDHAPRFQTDARANDILNAYYLPGHDRAIYSSMSPVNTFRTILNAYFGQQYPRLPDVAYRAVAGGSFVFERIPTTCAQE